MNSDDVTNGGTNCGLPPNIAGMLCYILCPPIGGIVFLNLEKNRLIKFHAWQSILLVISFLILLVLIRIFEPLIGFLSGVVGNLIGLLDRPLLLAFLTLSVISMVKAYKNEFWEIPIIGRFANRMISNKGDI